MALRSRCQGGYRPFGSGFALAKTAEQRPGGILLRAARQPKVMLDQTFTDMAAAQENWSEMDLASADGLDKLVWRCLA